MGAVNCIAEDFSFVKIKTSSGSAYTEFPSAELLKEDFGFVPKYTAILPDDFKFQKADSVHQEDVDKDGNISNKKYGICFSYTRDNSKKTQSLVLTTLKLNENEPEMPKDDNIIEYKDLSLTYIYNKDSSQNFCTWHEDGIEYNLNAIDYNFTQDKFIEMSKAIIDKE